MFDLGNHYENKKKKKYYLSFLDKSVGGVSTVPQCSLVEYTPPLILILVSNMIK